MPNVNRASAHGKEFHPLILGVLVSDWGKVKI